MLLPLLSSLAAQIQNNLNQVASQKLQGKIRMGGSMCILKAPPLISGISMVTCWRMTLIQAFNLLHTFFSMTRTGIGTFTAAQRKIFYGINLIVNTRTRSMVSLKDYIHKVKIMIASM